MLDTALKLLERPMLTVKRALRAGSSKQGNALRASVAWNCDAANHLQYTLLWLSKTVTFSTLHHIKRDGFLADDIINYTVIPNPYQWDFQKKYLAYMKAIGFRYNCFFYYIPNTYII